MKNTILSIKREIKQQKNNNAGYVGQILIEKLKFDHENNLADAEVAFRECHSRVFLVALPLEIYGNKMLRIFYPGKDGFYPYALWVCMNGKSEAEELMKKHNINEIDNLVRLHSCGFLTI